MTFQDVAFQVSTAQVKIIQVISSAQGLTTELLQVVTIHNGNIQVMTGWAVKTEMRVEQNTV